jgi:hypothetical protein
MDCLRQYKQDLIGLGVSQFQRKILEDSFARWYFNCDRIYIFPTKNIVSTHDLEYANKHKAAGFNVSLFLKESEKIYKLFRKNLCAALDAKINSDVKTYIRDTTPLSRINVTKKQLNRLKNLYLGPDKTFNCMTHNLLSMYELLGGDNLHLSIPPIFRGVELFGSPLNTHNAEYCSPFEIEKHFSSLGSFWEYGFHRSGIYLCNPPFDETLIRKAADKIICNINTTNHKVLVIVTIPVWDSHSQKIYNVENFDLGFEGLEVFKKSQYVKDHRILDRKKFPYWNYFTEKCVYVSWTHLLILSNLNDIFYKRNFHIDNILEPWKNFH